MEEIFGTPITHCFVITNAGDTSLKTIDIQNGVLSWSKTLTQTLAPGESTIVSYEHTIVSSQVNTAVVTATPFLEDGSPIYVASVQDTDTAEVAKFEFEPKIEVKNTVSQMLTSVLVLSAGLLSRYMRVTMTVGNVGPMKPPSSLVTSVCVHQDCIQFYTVLTLYVVSWYGYYVLL